MPLNFPKVKDVAWELRAFNRQCTHEATISFQILDDGRWWVHLGDASADLREHSYHAQIKLPGCNRHGKPRRFDSEAVAQELIDIAADMYLRDKDA
jgi:hypothetical protein